MSEFHLHRNNRTYFQIAVIDISIKRHAHAILYVILTHSEHWITSVFKKLPTRQDLNPKRVACEDSSLSTSYCSRQMNLQLVPIS